MKGNKIALGCLMITVLLLSGAIGYAAPQAQEVVIGYTAPLSGPAAEYGQDCVNGVDMAINEINKSGGITVKGKKYTFKLEKLDDRIDPTQAVNNARRFRDQFKTPAIFNPVFNTITPMMQINQEKGNEFLMMAYTSTPKVTALNNKLLVAIPPNFEIYVQAFSDLAWGMGARKAGMVVTLGAYGDEWRAAFKKYWEKKGGSITADKPANYYTETDFSAPLTAVLATKPDILLIGGPSAPTALVIEQARGLGYKGGFILIDQAKVDYIANILKSMKLMDDVIGVAAVANVPVPAAGSFDKKYVAAYKRMNTWEAALHYTAMFGLAKAMTVAGTVSDVHAIRAAFPKAFPLLGDQFPTEMFGVSDAGRTHLAAAVQMVKDGKYQKPDMYIWWVKNEKEVEQVKKIGKTNVPLKFMKPVE
ncbi:MAG: ABC transporter substrate-binding protein [Thermodesulfobacteriota bacterium]